MTNKMVENILIRYYQEKRELKYLDSQIEFFKNFHLNLSIQLKQNNFSVVADIKSVPFDLDCVQTSYSGSVQEKAIENAHTILQNQMKEVSDQIKILEYNKLVLSGFTSKIDAILFCLSEREVRILELKYSEIQSNVFISSEMNISESSFIREKANIINNIRLRLENNYSLSSCIS